MTLTPVPPVIPAGTGHPAYTQDLLAHPASVGIVRMSTETTLNCWGLEHLTEDALLIASELATNALKHTQGCVEDPERENVFKLKVERVRPDSVRISVYDRCTARPVRMNPCDGQEGGRGLVILDALAVQWGVSSQGSGWGKGVWAEIA